jgi:hypothetical protein
VDGAAIDRVPKVNIDASLWTDRVTDSDGSSGNEGGFGQDSVRERP